jgi:hypothetical protein
LKIRLDQNLSFRVARAVIAALPDREGYEVTYVGDVHPPGTSDPDWLRQFADEDGTAIVSGDFSMLRNWPDLVAYTESGLISFFPPPPFEKLNRFGKVAFIVRWWPAIVEQIKVSQRGDRWRIPMKWDNAVHTEMTLLRDPRVSGNQVSRETGAKILRMPRKRKPD